MTDLDVHTGIEPFIGAAASFSAQRGARCVRTEHLFEALVAHLDELPAAFLGEHARELERIETRLRRCTWECKADPVRIGRWTLAPDCAEILSRAERITDRLDAGAVTAAHVLLALLATGRTAPCRVMEAYGIDRARMLDDLQEALVQQHKRATPDPFVAGDRLLTPETESLPALTVQCTQPDPFERRFRAVRVEPTTDDDTREVLQAAKSLLESRHRVRFQSDAIDAAHRLAARHLAQGTPPDSAIAVLERACMRAQVRRAALFHASKVNESQALSAVPITCEDVRRALSGMASIPLERIDAEERVHKTHLEGHLARAVVGQPEAIARAIDHVREAMANPGPPSRPMLFAGPAGVGKSQLAQELARWVYGASNRVAVVDMSGFKDPSSLPRLFGAPLPGPGAREGAVTAALRDKPYSVLVFDRVECAHPRTVERLIAAANAGNYYDPDGGERSLRNNLVVLIHRCEGHADASAITRALERRFRPQLLERLAVVPFVLLDQEASRIVVKRHVDVLRRRLRERRIGVRMYHRAYAFLTQSAHARTRGAHGLRDAVNRYVAQPILAQVQTGRFGPGDVIDVMLEGGSLVCRSGAAHRSA